MGYIIVNSVSDMLDSFIADDLGGLITAICVMGASIALFRLFRGRAGGGR